MGNDDFQNMIIVRVPEGLKSELSNWATEEKITTSELVRRILSAACPSSKYPTKPPKRYRLPPSEILDKIDDYDFDY